MNRRRTLQNRQMMTVLCVVLLLLLSALVEACRDGETTPITTQPPIEFTLGFTTGTQFSYTTWTLTAGYPLPDKNTISSWRVLGTGGVYQGRSNVTAIADSGDTSFTGRVVDTLYLASSPTGDLSMYGFLARIAKRRYGQDLPPHWDVIASFSLGTSGLWTVGALDSAGQDLVYGSMAGASDYYSASVDGVTEAFPTYRVDLTGMTFAYSLWFSNAPNAIVQLVEEPEVNLNGQLQELAAVKTGAK